jgi:hypothetical protein
MGTQNSVQDIFDLDVREVVESAPHVTGVFASSTIPTLCSNECTGDCCTISGCS